MATNLYAACRYALIGAAVGGVTHQLYVTLRHREARLPLAKGSAEDAVTAWAIGAAVGQVAVGLPLLVFQLQVPIAEALLVELLALPFLSPLYVPAMFPKGRRWVAQNVPYLLAGTAALTTVVVYVYNFTTSATWGAVWLTTISVGLDVCGLLVFTFANRYNATILHLTSLLRARGVAIPCGTLFPIMHLVLGNLLALLLVCEAGALFSVSWWVVAILTVAASPSLPNVLSQHNQRQVDLEIAVCLNLGAMVVVFILSLVLPPAAWAVANQLWMCHAQDWKTLGNFEEETRNPPAWPFQGVMPSMESGRVLGSGPIDPPPPPATGTPPRPSPTPPAAASAASAAPPSAVARAPAPPPPRAPEAPLPVKEADRRERLAKAAEERMRLLSDGGEHSQA